MEEISIEDYNGKIAYVKKGLLKRLNFENIRKG
jgi:hypothetical protein